ncbi:hypothetical protein Tco_1249336, partial [Tanacetum coccineum]
MDYDQLFAEFNVGAARQTCLSTEVRLRFEHNLRERKKFERKCARQRQICQRIEDTDIASLRASCPLKEVEAAVAIATSVFVVKGHVSDFVIMGGDVSGYEHPQGKTVRGTPRCLCQDYILDRCSGARDFKLYGIVVPLGMRSFIPLPDHHKPSDSQLKGSTGFADQRFNRIRSSKVQPDSQLKGSTGFAAQ